MASQRCDIGESLVEVLLSVAILGIAMVAIMGGLGTLVVGTDIHRQQSDATVVLLSAAEAIKDSTNVFVTCATAANYGPPLAAVTRPSGWAAPTIVSVTYWNGTSFGSTCFDSTAAPISAPLQLVTLRVVSLNGRAELSLSVVKRRQS